MTPGDPGPIYRETISGLLSGALPVEPWNTWSNLIFVIVAAHIAVQTRLDFRRYPLIVFSLPVLLLGWLGGTVYHATRSHVVWLILDFVPILILTTAAALVYWRTVVGSAWLALPCFLAVAGIGRGMSRLIGFDRSVGISLGYASMALAVVLPLTLVVKRAKWRSAHLLFGCFTSFLIAIACRILDKYENSYVPMGTHFLWHLFGGISVWCLMLLTMRLTDQKQGREPKEDKDSASG
jgi:hemolysin III